ncbi:polysaccharide deacetylase family protein [Streptomyces montanisoli]|uniref:polysaccharide deacetylase family protein n=1 Tax=Streptomyces montanisoli TaxID=2798581 RepID=UPI0027DB5732|nr:polysaccharide deacetylase family protein [Streptomyces montanisoli]
MAAARAAGRAALTGTASVPPVVLAYHDIGRGSPSPYTVTPKALDAQLAALSAAGYRSLSSEEFVHYLRTGRTPPRRSVYLTFDDGTHGLWVYADRILARYHMRAASFLITGRVGHHRPYYLSWPEVERMARSGRWDFQDHTHDLHRRAQVDASGRRASALANRVWLAGSRRLESPREYRRRVEADLDRSIRDLTGHGLPRPRVFAYPFSEASAPANLPGAYRGILHDALRARFATTLTNTSGRPLPAGRRAAAAGVVQRVEVKAGSTVTSLLGRIRRWTAVQPGASPSPLARPALWERTDGSDRPDLGALTGAGPYPGRTGYAAASYRPDSSADWDGYTVEATATGLDAEGTNNVDVVVRDGSLDPVTVVISHSHVSVVEGRGPGRHETVRRALPVAATHRVRVTVHGGRTEVRVDGRVRVVRAGKHHTKEGDLSGGVALSVRNGDAHGHWPRFTALTVRAAGGHR